MYTQHRRISSENVCKHEATLISSPGVHTVFVPTMLGRHAPTSSSRLACGNQRVPSKALLAPVTGLAKHASSSSTTDLNDAHHQQQQDQSSCVAQQSQPPSQPSSYALAPSSAVTTVAPPRPRPRSKLQLLAAKQEQRPQVAAVTAQTQTKQTAAATADTISREADNGVTVANTAASDDEPAAASAPVEADGTSAGAAAASVRPSSISRPKPRRPITESIPPIRTSNMEQAQQLNPIDGQPFLQPRIQPQVNKTSTAMASAAAKAVYSSPAAARAAARASRAAMAASTAGTVAVNAPAQVYAPSNSSDGSPNGSRTTSSISSSSTTEDVVVVPDSSKEHSSSISNLQVSEGSQVDPAPSVGTTINHQQNSSINGSSNGNSIANSNGNGNGNCSTTGNSTGDNGSSSTINSNGGNGNISYSDNLSRARELMLAAMSSKRSLRDMVADEIAAGELDEVLPIITVDDVDDAGGSSSPDSESISPPATGSVVSDDQEVHPTAVSGGDRGVDDRTADIIARTAVSAAGGTQDNESSRIGSSSDESAACTANKANSTSADRVDDEMTEPAVVTDSVPAASAADVADSAAKDVGEASTASSTPEAPATSSPRRRVRTSSRGTTVSSSATDATAIQQLLAGQRDLAAAQRRASAGSGSSGSRKKGAASTNTAAAGASSAGKPGEVACVNGSWVMVGFEEDKKALERLVPPLQARLSAAVEAEQQHEEALIKSLYAKNNLKRLQKDGVVLLGLQASPHSVLYSNMVWRFTTSAAAAGRGTLPYHRFRQGDSLLITQHDPTQMHVVSSNGNKGSSRPGSGTGFDGIRPLDATVLEVRKEYLLLTVEKSDSDQMQRVIAQSSAAALAQWRLDQSVRDTTARRQMEAIKRLAHLRQKDSPFELLLRSAIVGTPNGHYVATLPPIWVRDSSWREDVRILLSTVQNLNDSQKRAIAQAVTRSLTLWQGPPGTGKTRTLLALVEVLVKTALKQSSRWKAMGPLLACADTNAAVDNLVEGLVGKGLKVVRLGQPAKVRAALRHLTLEAQAEATPAGQRAAALREASKALFERAKQAAEGSNLAWASSSSTGLVSSSRSRRPTGSSSGKGAAVVVGQLDSESLEADAKKKWGQAEGLSREASKQVLKDAHVVCATCAGAGDPLLADMHFNVVVIDEATQATEPATLVPLVQGTQCAIMAGDPCQLPPTIISRQAYTFKLDRTLFDRLQQEVGLSPLLLDTQYRMNPAISQFPSRHFYGGKLQDGVSAAAKPAATGVEWPVEGQPVMVVGLRGLEEKAQKSGEKARSGNAGQGSSTADVTSEVGLEDASYRNLPEARVALQALYALMKSGDAATGAILTPYKGQVRSLEHGLRELAPWFHGLDVTISSVDGYQGREADVIVFSAVRSNDKGNIGFVSDPRRLNVAITRPRRGLVVVCNPNTLARGSSDWSRFVSFAEQQMYLCGPEQLPSAPWQEEGLDPFSRDAVAGGVTSSNSPSKGRGTAADSLLLSSDEEYS